MHAQIHSSLIQGLFAAVVTAVCVFSPATFADVPYGFKAELFSPKFDTDKPVFRYSIVEKKGKGNRIEFDAKYSEVNGKVALHEYGAIGTYGEVLTYQYDQKQTGEKGTLVR